MKTSNEPEEPIAEAGGRRKLWGQHRRLLFIDQRLQFDGKVNRSDLTDFFSISVPQASQDLRRYDDLAPGNLQYDLRSKSYVASQTFQPWSTEVDARPYLRELEALHEGVIQSNASFVGFVPPVALAATPSRPLPATLVADFVRAIRDRRTVEIEYQSMRTPAPTRRVLSPHGLGCDGLRWHVRAYCATRQEFRDFAIGRCRWLGYASLPYQGSDGDADWQQLVDIQLVPHPKLTPAQRAFVEHDYGMESDQPLVLRCRKAMLFYTLRHLNLFDDRVDEDPARQHVIVANRDEVNRWLKMS